MYEKILVPLDGSKLAECVIPHIQAMAANGVTKEIYLVQVIEPYQKPPFTDYIFEEGKVKKVIEEEQIKKIEAAYKTAAEEYLKKIARELNYENVKINYQVMVHSSVAESLAEFVDKNQIDLIVIATHGRSGVSRWVWGSVADRILRSSCVPVLMVRAPGCVPGI